MLTSGLKLEEYTCSTRMIWKSALHYAGFWLVLALASGQLTAEQKEQILDLHNEYRGMVIPEAADMLHMTWNETLAAVAQGYAAQCIWEHNDDVMDTLGENLYITSSLIIIGKAITKWFDEYKNYDYANDTCMKGMCGHYTQMVWAESNTVGCAAHFCETVTELDYVNATILVCNYFPQGNKWGEQPYEAGEPCSNCPQEATECVENACAQTESSEKESSTHAWLTDALRTEPVSSATFTELSVATLLLAGLLVSFAF